MVNPKDDAMARSICERLTCGVADEDLDFVVRAIASAREEGDAAGFERGRRAGLEEAAHVADEHTGTCYSDLCCRTDARPMDSHACVIARGIRALIGGGLTDAEHARRNQQVAIGLDVGRDGMSDCTGCTDPRSEGTHQMGTRQHPTGGDK